MDGLHNLVTQGKVLYLVRRAELRAFNKLHIAYTRARRASPTRPRGS